LSPAARGRGLKLLRFHRTIQEEFYWFAEENLDGGQQ
jgi:hypothetical protein